MAAVDSHSLRYRLCGVPAGDRRRASHAVPVLPVLMMPAKSDYRMTTRWRVGWILPRLMLAVMGTDGAARCVPLVRFAIRPNRGLEARNRTPKARYGPTLES